MPPLVVVAGPLGHVCERCLRRFATARRRCSACSERVCATCFDFHVFEKHPE